MPMTSKFAFGLALLVLAASIWVYLGGPAGSQETPQETDPGVWGPASGLAPENCNGEVPECAGLSSHAAVALDRPDCRLGLPSDGYPCGKVLLAGGAVQTPDPDPDAVPTYDSRLAKIYDPVKDTWAVASSMTEMRSGLTMPPAAVLLNGPECRVTLNLPDHCGRVLVIGGDNVSGIDLSVATSEVYEPVLDDWGSQKDLPGRFHDPVAVLLDGPGCADKCGMVLVIGNKTGVSALYDPRSDEWTTTSGPIIAREGIPPTLTLLSNPGCADKCGNVLLAGGSPVAGEPVQAAELYDPAREIWVPTGVMKVPRYKHSAALLSGFQCEAPSPPDWCGNVLVAGGTKEDNVAYDSAERYRPEQGDWVMASALDNHMHAPRQALSSNSLKDGRVLVVGGTNHDDPDKALTTGDVYDPTANDWTAITEKTVPNSAEALKTSRFFHTSTRLPEGPLSGCGVNCGAVLVAGGLGRPGDPVHDDIVTAELFYPTPVIGQVVPPVCGGAEVSIKGAGFASATQVRFDGVPAESFRVHSNRPGSEILAVSPHGGVGTQALTVETKAGTTEAKSVSYPSPPAIASLDPDRGPVVGGTAVTITGSSLGQVSTVKFGSEPATAFEVLSDTQISAVSPSHLRAETVDVSVTVGGCTSQRPFTYFTLPLADPDPVDPIPAGGAAAQNTTIVNPGAPPSAPGSQQSIGGGTAPPAPVSGPPSSGTAPAVLTAPAPAPLPGPVAGQTAAPTLVSGASMVPSVEAAAPGAALATASVAPEEEPAIRHGMVRADSGSSAPALATSSMALGSLMLIGCCASVRRKDEPRPGPQGAY